MSAHVPSDSASNPDELWEALLSGELDPGSPEFERCLADHPDLAERWRQLQNVEATFQRVADDEARVLAEMLNDDSAPRLQIDVRPPPDMETPEGAVEQLAPPALHPLEGERAGKSRVLAGLGGFLALAAAVLVVWFVFDTGSPEESGQPDLEALRGQQLSENDFAVRMDSSEGRSVLQWEADPELGWFDLAVFEVDGEFDPSGVELGEPLLEVRELFDHRLDLSTLEWPTSEKPLWIRITQRIEGLSGADRTGGLLLAP